MSDYTKANLKSDVDDQAPKFGLSPDLEGHFARSELDLEQSGVSYQKLASGYRIPFGHTHAEQEEVYVVVAGSGRLKIGDELVEVGQLDAVRVAPGAWRAFEAGPDGLELLAFGSRRGMAPDANDGEMEQGWWSD